MMPTAHRDIFVVCKTDLVFIPTMTLTEGDQDDNR